MKTKTKGSGLIFAVVLLFVILGMVVTLSSITVLETKMSQKTKSSVGAFYNSESGVEWALNKIAGATNPDTTTVASLFGIVSGNKAPCPSGFGCDVYFLKEIDNTVADPSLTKVSDIGAVRSVGSQGGETQRAIEAAVASSDEKYRISCGHDNQKEVDEQMAFCCRTRVNDGETDCKRYQEGSWNFYPPPWPVDTLGKYDISCGHDYNMIICCRADAITGSTKCKSNEGWGEPWGNYPDPF